MSSIIMKPFYTLIIYWESIYISTYITFCCCMYSAVATFSVTQSPRTLAGNPNNFTPERKALEAVSALLSEAQTKEFTILEKPSVQACITNSQYITLCNPSLCHNELGPPDTLYIHLGCFWIHRIAALNGSTWCMLSYFPSLNWCPFIS